MSALYFYAVLIFGIVCNLNAESVEEDEGDQYFGTPLGALHFSSDGTSAEIYAADEFTIIFNHFYHNPKQSGCTAMMVGPARSEDHENVIEGHGLLLAPAHPPVAAAKRRRRRRQTSEDQLESRLEQLRSWPVEFDHLLMEPASSGGGGEVKSATVSPTSRISSLAEKPQLRRVNIESARMKELNKVENSTYPVRTIASNQTKTTHATLSSQTPPSAPQTQATTTATTTTTSSNTKNKPTTSNNNSANVKPLILLGSRNRDNFKHNTLSRRVLPGAIMEVPAVDGGDDASLGVVVTSSVVNNVNKNYNYVNGVDRSESKKEKKRSIGETFAINNKNSASPIVTSVVQQQPKKDSGIRISQNSEGVRRAPIRTDAEQQQPLIITPKEDGDKWTHIDNEKGTLAPALATTTPLFWVIKDPREARRQRLLELRRKVSEPEDRTTTTTAEPVTTRFENRFELPKIRDKLATFSLTNGAKINNYKWIGLYDQCLRRHIPLVTLRDVDPPREEKIMPLSGWSHNVTSYRVHILNCNTILVPGFTYDDINATKNTYFFVGVGQFPTNIERQVKAIVVGNRKDEPLREYNGEDVLLRLPRGYRTFDIDFISVYNTDEHKSFGHVIIPSLLVPPCSED